MAAGHLAALEKGVNGRRYVLGGQDVTLAEMLREIARLMGRRPPRVALPRGPLFPMAWVNEKLCALTGREPFLTVDSLKKLSAGKLFNDLCGFNKKNKLGLKAPSIDEVKKWCAEEN